MPPEYDRSCRLRRVKPAARGQAPAAGTAIGVVAYSAFTVISVFRRSPPAHTSRPDADSGELNEGEEGVVALVVRVREE